MVDVILYIDNDDDSDTTEYRNLLHTKNNKYNILLWTVKNNKLNVIKNNNVDINKLKTIIYEHVSYDDILFCNNSLVKRELKTIYNFCSKNKFIQKIMMLSENLITSELSKKPEEPFVLYTDASLKKSICSISIYISNHTNNGVYGLSFRINNTDIHQAELFAILCGLKQIPPNTSVLIKTDSNYAYNKINTIEKSFDKLSRLINKQFYLLHNPVCIEIKSENNFADIIANIGREVTVEFGQSPIK